jgi:hypothetical protein
MAHNSRPQRGYQRPQFTPRAQDYPEITHSEATLTLESGQTVPVIYKFDRQPRPHLILTCQSLNGYFLAVQHRPSYWDLEPATQAHLLGMQLALGHNVTQQLGLPEAAFTAAIHLGTWVSSKAIHSHIMLPLQPYFQLFSLCQQKPSWDRNDCSKRALFLEKLSRDRAKYHAEDRPKVMQEVVAASAPPDLQDAIERFRMTFDPSGDGTSAIDLSFGQSFRLMSHKVLVQALNDLNELVQVRLGMTACFYFFPAPGNAAGDTMRVVCPPEVFVTFLPSEERAAWAKKWDQGDPIQRACGDDVAQLSRPAP